MRVLPDIGRWALLACALTACGDPYEPPTLEGIRMESGNNQTGIIGGPLAQPLVVSERFSLRRMSRLPRWRLR